MSITLTTLARALLTRSPSGPSTPEAVARGKVAVPEFILPGHRAGIREHILEAGLKTRVPAQYV